MNNPAGFDRCLTFINCQLQPKTRPVSHSESGAQMRAVTISRQCGSGALVVAGKLAERLQSHSPKGAPPWTVFDRNLMEKVLEDHNLPKRLAKYLPEDRISQVQDIMDDLFGIHPPSWTVVPQISETILHLAGLGNVILIGRGGHVITAKLPDVLHVRLVAPLEKRVEHAQEFYRLTRKGAREFVLREDRGRRRYLKKYFAADIDNPLLYHMILNTGLMSYDQAAQTITEAVLKKA
jgi:cytidylate kinase